MKGFFKKSGIYFDTEVKKGSNNAITSDAVAKAIEEGGGGGSTDYADLTNKPKINNVELSGNKSLSDLGVASETDLESLSDNVGDLSDLNTTDKTSIVNAINEAVAGGGGGSTDYADLTNKPKINNVELSGNKSLSDLGVASKTDLESLSDNVGDLSDLNTTDKTSIVNAINEAVAGGGGGGGSSDGVKYQRFASKATTSSTIVGGVSYVTFTEANIKTWFDTAPTRIHAVIASKSSGTVVKVAIRNATSNFVIEQASSEVTYEYVGVFYV